MRRPRLSDIRRFIERTLHPRRRRRALKELGSMEQPHSFLFICYGNICRSPYAAKAFERLLNQGGRPPGRIDSAGFVGPGRSTPPDGIVVAGDRQVELNDHISKVFTPHLVREHDLVVVMDGWQQRGIRRRLGSGVRILVLGDLDPHPIETRAIFDPWQHALAGFERSYDRIDRCLAELDLVLHGPVVHPDAVTGAREHG